MPKKRKQSFQVKPQSTRHPSLGSGGKHNGTGTSTEDKRPTQVNEILQHLRQAQARPSSTDNSGSSESTIPSPMSSSLLYASSSHQPAETLTPRERMMIRARQRRLPGPPAPPCWSLKKNLPKTQLQLEEDAVRGSRRLDRLPELTMPPEGSLRYMCLRKLALEWSDSVNVWNGSWLSIVPAHLKQALLAFLVVYGPSFISFSELNLMFEDVIDGEAISNGADGISHAHLGYATNPVIDRRGYKDLAKFLFGTEYYKRIAASKKRARSASPVDDVPESWDNSDGQSEAEKSPLPMTTINAPRFSALTHLSLANASYSSWRYLLRDLTPHLKQLTHLSLAFWPSPALTPNARTATIQGPMGAINFSATTMYSALDGDWSEAVGVLQQLGKDLICLKWLDLQGCSVEGGWVGALSYAKSRRVDWANTFRGLETLIIDQGHTPTALSRYCTRDEFVNEWATWALWTLRHSLPEEDIATPFLFDFRHRHSARMESMGVNVRQLDVYHLFCWLEREQRVERTVDHINSVRRDGGVARKLDVQGTPYPAWAKAMVQKDRSGKTPEIDHRMLRLIGLSDDEMKLCLNNLEFNGNEPLSSSESSDDDDSWHVRTITERIRR